MDRKTYLEPNGVRKPTDLSTLTQPGLAEYRSERELAEAVSHFLYWSGWLENCKADAAVFLHDGQPDRIEHMGIATFRRLEEAMDRNYQDWRTWNSNFDRPEHRRTEA